MNDYEKHLEHIPGIKEKMERQKHGISSFKLHHPDQLETGMQIEEGITFLDLGCGAGDYAVWASSIVGRNGSVYAVDRWKGVIDALEHRCSTPKLANVKPIQHDIINPLPFSDSSIDVCLTATILHALDLPSMGAKVFQEIERVLKPNGRLITIDCKKEEEKFGPPIHIRLAPEDVEQAVSPYGFTKTNYVDLGCTYMLTFIKTPPTTAGAPEVEK